jgi:hypothetical protein
MAAEDPPKAASKNPYAGRYRKVSFHDAQKLAETGIGKYEKSWTKANYTPEELERLIEEHRAAQKAKNLAYKKAAKEVALRERTDLGNVRLPAPTPPPDVTRETTLDLHLDEGTGNSTVLLGSSKAGKSTAMMRIFRDYYAGGKQITTLFSSSPQAPVYEGASKKMDRLVHVTGYSPQLIRMAQAINRGTENHYEFCFLLDDIIDQRQDATLAELILTLRNSMLSSVVCLQYVNLLAKMNRGNVNNVLLFRFNTESMIEIAIAEYLKNHFRRMGVPTDLMVDFYKRLTDDHGFIYVRPATDTISFHRLRR